jgi:hypothetical protein
MQWRLALLCGALLHEWCLRLSGRPVSDTIAGTSLGVPAFHLLSAERERLMASLSGFVNDHGVDAAA